MPSSLKECPFCGNSDLHTGVLRVVCSSCGASGPVSVYPEQLWNIRKADPSVELDPDNVSAALDIIWQRNNIPFKK